jgi:uncharacterized protein (TIGR00369 family)
MSLLEDVGSHLTGLEKLRVMMESDRRPGMGQTLDIRLTEVQDGRVAFESTTGAHLENPNATVHGGFTATMLDFACAYAVLTRMAPGQTCATLEMKVAYHRAMTHQT